MGCSVPYSLIWSVNVRAKGMATDILDYVHRIGNRACARIIYRHPCRYLANREILHKIRNRVKGKVAI